MSSVFTIYCLSCRADGPKLRRTVGGRGVLHAANMPATAEGKKRGKDELGAFLLDHEYCDMRLGLEAGVAHHHPRPERTA